MDTFTKIIIKFILFQFLLNIFIIAEDLNHLNDLKWKKRIIIIVDDESFAFKNRLKKYQKEFEARDISIFFYNKPITYFSDKIMSMDFSRSVERKIKNINPNHQLILIGKDGEVKKSYLYETKIMEIFHDIDQMPMRISEMRK